MSGSNPRGYIIAGTDTGIGKTTFAAALVGAIDGCYWKPVQAGLEGETDSAAVKRLSALPADRILPNAYSLKMPASPHIASAAEGIDIRQRQLALPKVTRPLVVEAAGGLMVPMSPRLMQIDLIAHWGLPVILCARTTLGTINHSLLSLEAMRRRRIPLHGIAFVGKLEPAVEATIARLGHVQRLGRLPHLPKLDARSLATAFATGFDIADFQA